jgi:hypothetical protein
MPQITEDSFSNPSTTISILEKGLHGGLLERDQLEAEEIEFCEETDWVERVIRFKCTDCGNWHTAPPGDERCLQTQQPVETTDERQGYRVIANSKLDIEIEEDYNLFIAESSSTIDSATLPYKSIIFVPDEDEIVFSDRAGSTVLLPLYRLPEFVAEHSPEEIIDDINDKRRRLVNWDRLDAGGDEFEKIVFRLIKRDPEYFNESWGGSGPDQGKDGFCSIDLGGRPTRILVQAKFNNNGDAVNDRQVERSCQKADRHDCSGVIIATIRTSGDLESEFEAGTLQTRSVNYLRIWAGPEIKEKLSHHPDLIARFFLE